MSPFLLLLLLVCSMSAGVMSTDSCPGSVEHSMTDADGHVLLQVQTHSQPSASHGDLMKQDTESTVETHAQLGASGSLGSRGASMKEKREVDWKVLDIGPGRTGTQSTKTALEHLGFAPFHAGNPFCRLATMGPWCSFITGNSTFEETLQVMEGHDAALDYPMYAPKIYRAVLQHYPNAKFILPITEPEHWFESMVRLVESNPGVFTQENRDVEFMKQRDLLGPKYAKIYRDCRNTVDWRCNFTAPVEENEDCLNDFRAHYQMARNEIPADRLLLFNISDGYTTLAPFLGKPVPDEPFPRIDSYSNYDDQDQDSDEFQEAWSTDNCPNNSFSNSWQPSWMSPQVVAGLGAGF